MKSSLCTETHKHFPRVSCSQCSHYSSPEHWICSWTLEPVLLDAEFLWLVCAWEEVPLLVPRLCLLQEGILVTDGACGQECCMKEGMCSACYATRRGGIFMLRWLNTVVQGAQQQLTVKMGKEACAVVEPEAPPQNLVIGDIKRSLLNQSTVYTLNSLHPF